MDMGFETLVIFVLLIPGFISSAILSAIVVRGETGNLARVIEGLMFSFAIYAVVWGFVRFSPIVVRLLEYSSGKSTYVVRPIPEAMVLILAVAVLLPILAGYSINHDVHMKFLRAIRVTKKTSRESLWLDIFTDLGQRPVVANLKNGKRIRGWPLYYSSRSGERGLYLYRPAYLDPGGGVRKLPIHGLFLVEKDCIRSIEFAWTKKEREAGNVPGE